MAAGENVGFGSSLVFTVACHVTLKIVVSLLSVKRGALTAFGQCIESLDMAISCFLESLAAPFSWVVLVTEIHRSETWG